MVLFEARPPRHALRLHKPTTATSCILLPISIIAAGVHRVFGGGGPHRIAPQSRIHTLRVFWELLQITMRKPIIHLLVHFASNIHIRLREVAVVRRREVLGLGVRTS